MPIEFTHMNSFFGKNIVTWDSSEVVIFNYTSKVLQSTLCSSRIGNIVSPERNGFDLSGFMIMFLGLSGDFMACVTRELCS